MFLTTCPLRRSRVRVELEVSTREERVGGQHQGGQGGHGGGEHQDDHHGDKNIRQSGKHGGDNGVKTAGGDVDLVGEQPAEAAQEVAAASHHHSEEGGYHGGEGYASGTGNQVWWNFPGVHKPAFQSTPPKDIVTQLENEHMPEWEAYLVERFRYHMGVNLHG